MAYGLRIRNDLGQTILSSSDESLQVLHIYDLNLGANIEFSSATPVSSDSTYNYYTFSYVDGTGPLTAWDYQTRQATPSADRFGLLYQLSHRIAGTGPSSSSGGWILETPSVMGIRKLITQPVVGTTYFIYSFFMERSIFIPFTGGQSVFEAVSLAVFDDSLTQNLYTDLEYLSGNEFVVRVVVEKETSRLKLKISAQTLLDSNSSGYTLGTDVSGDVSGLTNPNAATGLNRSNFKVYIMGR